MKNIESLITEIGLELTAEQTEALVKGVNENYKTIAEFEKKDAKIATLSEKVKQTEETLKTFEGIDAEGMRSQIAELQKSLDAKDAEYAEQIKAKDFNALLEKSIAEVKGKNAKAITSLLDIDALKASANQKEDIANALKALTEAEDSSFLFEAVEQPPKGVGSPIGSVGRKTQVNTLDEIYKGNPYYHPTNN